MGFKTENVPLDRIRLIQARGEINPSVVDEYAEAIQDGADMPPADSCFDGEFYWVWDGCHRTEAYKGAGWEVVPLRIRDGSRADAVALAAGANETHGLRRTPAHRKAAVLMLLAEFPDWSTERLCETAKVSWYFADKVRTEATAGSRAGTSPQVVEGKNGVRQPARKGKAAEKAKQNLAEMKASRERLPGEDDFETPPEVADAADLPGDVPLSTDEMRDATGQTVPQGLRDAFGDQMFADYIAVFKVACKDLSHAANTWAPFLRVEDVQSHLDAMIAALNAATPYAVCKHCDGEGHGCDKCRAGGYLPEWRWEELRYQRGLES